MTVIHNRQDARKWQEQYDASAPKVGALAPDFTLFDTTGEHSLTLSALQGRRPVALVFGSFT
jgi:hypothetical protein